MKESSIHSRLGYLHNLQSRDYFGLFWKFTSGISYSKMPGDPNSSRTNFSGKTGPWGLTFIIFGLITFFGFLFAAVLSKFLPPFDNRFLNAIQNDRYYCILVPLTLPTLVVAIYFHWLSMKLFKHA